MLWKMRELDWSEDAIIVFGSFYTVADVLTFTQ
jgi:folylpolyglutamate synthase/dihydropteroate synthase